MPSVVRKCNGSSNGLRDIRSLDTSTVGESSNPRRGRSCVAYRALVIEGLQSYGNMGIDFQPLPKQEVPFPSPWRAKEITDCCPMIQCCQNKIRQNTLLHSSKMSLSKQATSPKRNQYQPCEMSLRHEISLRLAPNLLRFDFRWHGDVVRRVGAVNCIDGRRPASPMSLSMQRADRREFVWVWSR
jgi:hypothetical protein